MDVIVIAEQGGAVWRLTDLLGRSMGNIREDATDCFTIYPEGHAVETVAGIPCGPYTSLDVALAEIETYTGRLSSLSGRRASQWLISGPGA